MKLFFIILIGVLSIMTSSLYANISCQESVKLEQDSIEFFKDKMEYYINLKGDSLFISSQKLYCTALETDDKDLLAYTLNFLGLHYYQKEDYPSALNCLLDAKEIISDSGQRDYNFLQNQNFLSLVYYDTDQYVLAIDHAMTFYHTSINKNFSET